MTRILEIFTNPYNYSFHLIKRLTEELMPIFGLKLKNFYDHNDFPFLKILEDNYPTIKNEFLNVYKNQHIPNIQDANKNVGTYTDDNNWKIFVLWVYGNRVTLNADLCPVTESIVKQIPNFHTAFFSILEPGKQIKKHRGVYRGSTLAHLGLLIPEPHENQAIFVRGEKMHWQEGKAFVFEDSFTHWVENKSNHTRVVLIIEFKRDVPKFIGFLNRFVQHKIHNSKITKNIIKNFKKEGKILE